MFSGSYDPEDVVFLLKPVQLQPTPVAEKERLIQSGTRHYSELISREQLPSPVYLRVFHTALQAGLTRFAQHVLRLAGLIAATRPDAITLVSLARAGTPIGVLLKRTLQGRYGREVFHYSVSLIRGRGIDAVALGHILRLHASASLVFVDGWTGKGGIADELARAVQRFNGEFRAAIDPGLFVLADLCGTAAVAASAEDWLIPSAVLGATVSGLVSRSILNRDVVKPGDFHGCLYYREFEPDDLSRWLVDRVSGEIARQPHDRDTPAADRGHLQRTSAEFLADVQARYGVRDVNHIKPGIGEATRVLLRRVPERLLLRDSARADVAHLRVLAQEKGVCVTVEPKLPYLAAALIKELD